MKNIEIRNDKKLLKLAESHDNGKAKMSKKRRMRIDKIKADETLTEQEKISLLEQMTDVGDANKRVKRS